MILQPRTGASSASSAFWITSTYQRSKSSSWSISSSTYFVSVIVGSPPVGRCTGLTDRPSPPAGRDGETAGARPADGFGRRSGDEDLGAGPQYEWHRSRPD